jgi:hypothetical protein
VLSGPARKELSRGRNIKMITVLLLGPMGSSPGLAKIITTAGKYAGCCCGSCLIAPGPTRVELTRCGDGNKMCPGPLVVVASISICSCPLYMCHHNCIAYRLGPIGSSPSPALQQRQLKKKKKWGGTTTSGRPRRHRMWVGRTASRATTAPARVSESVALESHRHAHISTACLRLTAR